MLKLIKTRKWTPIQLAAGILMISLLAGCAANKVARENSGSLKLSSEVSQIFQTYQVLPQYRYYITGSVTRPHAIMGIDRNYTFDSSLWQAAADLTPAQLKKWVDQMLGFKPATRTLGAYILDPGGERVGIWYSPYPDVPVQVYPDKRIVIIYRTSFPKAGNR